MKTMKRILALIASAILALGVFAFTACGDKEAKCYTIVVTYEDGTPVEGVGVALCKESCPMPTFTDSKGEATFDANTYTPYAYHITLSVLPSGYTYNMELYTPETFATVTVTLELIAE